MLEYTFHCSVDDIRKRTDRPTTEMSERRGWESCTNGKDDIKRTTGCFIFFLWEPKLLFSNKITKQKFHKSYMLNLFRCTFNIDEALSVPPTI